MIRTLFALLYFTITLLFAFQVRSELLDPIAAGLVLSAVALSSLHVYRVLTGKYDVRPVMPTA